MFSYAEGAVSFGPNQYRQDIAHRVTSSYANSLDEITETVEHISETFDGMPNSLSFDVGGATHLSGHINAFSNSLTLYYQGRILPHQIAEDAHTIIELLLRDVLGSSSNKLSFEEKVQSAEDKGCFDQKLAVALVQLKNLRRDAKHRGQGISNKVIDRLLPPVITASHRLARIIRNDFES